MKLFLSWSGDPSREVAGMLKKYLPVVLADIDVFMSQRDIASGERWGIELAKTLDDSNFGILLLTRTNLSSPWLLFEAGALTKHAHGKACGLLLGDLSPVDVKAPLSQFQNRRFTKTDVRQLFHDINALVEKRREAEQLDLIFEKWWPDIDAEYSTAITNSASQTTQAPARSQEDLLQEVLVTVREIARRNIPQATIQGDLLSRPLSENSLAEYTAWKFPDRPVSEHWQREMLRDLDLTKYPSLRHIDDAVEAARHAIKAYASEAPELFRNGTDFITKALGFVDIEFRNHHNFAVATREAFKKYAHLVKYA